LVCLSSAGISVVSVYTLASLGRSGVTPLNLTIVADCALYTEANIRLMSNIKWLSRVPLTLKSAKSLVTTLPESEFIKSN
jgi:transposase